MLAGSHRNAWPDETGTGGRTNRNTQYLTTSTEMGHFRARNGRVQKRISPFKYGILFLLSSTNLSFDESHTTKVGKFSQHNYDQSRQ